MKILHTEASLGWGGQEIRILEESRGLIERGHQVSLLCPEESKILHGAHKYGIRAIAMPIGEKNISGLLALRSWIKNNSIDVINTHSSTDSWLSALACLTLKNPPPIVRTRHISSSIPNNKASHWLYAQSAAHIVTTGEALRKQVIVETKADPNRVTSVPTGIDPDRFYADDKKKARSKLALDETSNYIGIVATLRSWKGHLYLLEAQARIKEKNWKLLIIGDGPYREVLIEKTKKLGLQEKVIFAGQQNNPEDWMRALDIFCLPSYANEGVPQAILQAMFTELPIVSTSAGAITEAIKDGESGIIVPKKDPEALVIALKRFISDADFAKHCGTSAKARAMNYFSREQMLDQMESIFQQTYERNTRS